MTAPPQRPPVAFALTPQMIPSKESSSGFLVGLVPAPAPEQDATIATLRAENEAKTAEIARLTGMDEGADILIGVVTDSRNRLEEKYAELYRAFTAAEARATRAEAECERLKAAWEAELECWRSERLDHQATRTKLASAVEAENEACAAVLEKIADACLERDGPDDRRTGRFYYAAAADIRANRASSTLAVIKGGG